MKQLFTLSLMLISFFGNAQTNAELMTEVDKIKSELNVLKSEIQSVKTQNLYLKKVLDINAPVLEVKSNDNEYRITKVVGNKKDKTISITLLAETKGENKSMELSDLHIVDLEGNKYKVDLYKSSVPHPKLSTNIPLKLIYTFKDIIDEPKLIRLFKYRASSSLERNSFEKARSIVEFRDLNVTWE